MQISGSCVRRAAATAGTVLAIVGTSFSPAFALPVGANAAAADSPLLLQVQVGQHLKYPGYKSAAGKAARAHRDAPHYICNKRPEECR